MCKTPIKLRNPSKHFDVNSDRVYITAPCGHCSDCNNNKRFQWQVRVYYHYLDHHDHGGFTLFMTLTYNNTHLPHVTIKKVPIVQYDNNGEPLKKMSYVCNSDGEIIDEHEVLDYAYDKLRISCFDKRDLQRFTKNVKQYLRDNYPGSEMSYFISSEYGDDKLYIDRHGNEKQGTHRPHYHCLFFFKGNITIREAKEVLSKHWKGAGYGHVDFTSRPGVMTDKGKVDGPGAIGYVCKYVQKDLNNDKILRNHIEYFQPNLAEDFDTKTTPLQVLPFNMQSQKLGLYVVEYTNSKYPGLIDKGKCKFPMYQDYSKRVSFEVVDLPLYIERKVFCHPQSETPNRSYIYNDRGLDMLQQRNLERRESLIEDIETILRDYNTMISPDLLKVISKKSNRHYLRVIDFINDIKSNLKDYSVRQLVDYSLLIQNYFSTNDHYATEVLSDDFSVNDFIIYIRHRLTKDRSGNLQPTSSNAEFSKYSHGRYFIPELERSLFLYSCYLMAVHEIEENEYNRKVDLELSHAPYLKTRLYHA